MVGVDREVRYSCPLLSKIVHNGDGVEREAQGGHSSTGLHSHPRTLRMAAECPHSHQLLQSREHLGIHDEAWGNILPNASRGGFLAKMSQNYYFWCFISKNMICHQ